MQHTPNFHLPQWDETDRVMRTDFNQMCANIEDGLSENQQATAQLAGQVGGLELATSQNLASTAAVLRADAMQSLYRLAYNNYCCIAEARDPIWQTAGFHQRMLGEALPSGVSGLKPQGSCAWMGFSPDGLAGDGFSTEIIQEMNLTVEADIEDIPLIAAFTPHASGVLESLQFHIFTPKSHYASTNRFEYSITDAVSGLVEKTGTVTWSSQNSYGLQTGPVLPCGFSVCHGRRYELRFTGACKMPYQYQVLRDSMDPTYTLSGLSMPTATLTRSFTVEDVSRGGSLWVRYISRGTGGSLSLNWGGKTLSPRIIRSIATGSGAQMLDAEFLNDAATAKSQRVTLTIRCNKGGTIELHSWGAAMI